MNFILRPSAISEGIQARTWIAEYGEQAEHDFSAALEAAFSLVHSYPHAGTRLPGAYRRVLVRGYP